MEPTDGEDEETRAPATGLGTQDWEAVDAGLWIHFHYVSITTRTHTQVIQGRPSLFQTLLQMSLAKTGDPQT